MMESNRLGLAGRSSAEGRLLRRRLLLAAASAPFAGTVSASPVLKRDAEAAQHLQQIEREFGGRLGLYALNTANGATLGHRAGERFVMCSTFKVFAAAACLARNARQAGFLAQRVYYGQSDLVDYSPITEKHLAGGMTIAELCAATLQYSDNTAVNLMLRRLGGPAGLTRYARSIGDTTFRLDRWEPELNTATPGDLRDTTTPQAHGRSLQRLVLGDALAPDSRDQLRDWMLGNTTGATRIQAGMPNGWKVADKTGTGAYGIANDVAVVWPPERPPVVIVLFTVQPTRDAKPRNEVLAAASRVVADWVQAS
ncbi:MAG: class beta-lactamase [Pseudomonadota bacterium]|jgi:beta-lactamase class A